MKWRLNLILMLMLIAPAATAQNRLMLQTHQVGDSDNARQSGFYLKYRRTLSQTDYAGAGIGTHDFYDNIGDQRFTVLTAEYHRRLPGSTAFVGNVAQYLSSSWSPFTGNAALIFTPGEKWRIEAMAGYDIVDTYTSIELKNQFSTLGLSSDYRFHQDWMIVAYIFRQDFKDDNVRQGIRGRLIWETGNVGWLRTELNFRYYGCAFRGIGYFSPDDLTEGFLQATAFKTMFDENAVFTALLGLGLQGIDDADLTGLFLGELRGRGWFTQQWGMTGRIGARNTGDTNFAASTDGYIYWYGNLELIYAW